MNIQSVQPSFTGRGQLSRRQIEKLIKEHRTIPMGVNTVKPKSEPIDFDKFVKQVKNFFKGMFDIV